MPRNLSKVIMRNCKQFLSDINMLSNIIIPNKGEKKNFSSQFCVQI